MTNIDNEIVNVSKKIQSHLLEKSQEVSLPEHKPEKPGLLSTINLDEVGDVRLDPQKRAKRHTELALQLAKEKDFGIGKHFTVIETPEFGENTGIVLVKGLTESKVEGLNYTQHEISIKIKNASVWASLSPEERQEKFMREIIPKATSTVVAINGWGGNEGIWRPYMPLLINPDQSDSENKDQVVGSIVGMKQNEWASRGNIDENLDYVKNQLKDLPDNVLVIGISTMGGLGELDPENAKKITKEGIITQVFEAVDEIGMEITEAKMKDLETDEYKDKKRKLVRAVHYQLVNDPGAFGDVEWKRKLLELNTMLNDEEMLAKGRYADNLLSEFVGHSMGGNIALTVWKHAILGQKMPDEYIRYRQSVDKKTRSKITEGRIRIEKINEDIFSDSDLAQDSLTNETEIRIWNKKFESIGGIHNSNFLSLLRKRVSTASALREANDIPAYDIHDKYQLLNILSLMPVVTGNMSKDNPRWVEQIKKRIPNWPVTLSKDPLIGLITEVSKLSETGGKALVDAGTVTRIVGSSVRKYVGEGTPNDEELWAQYILNIRDVLFITACHDVLDKMSPPFFDETLPLVDEASLARLSGFTGSEDNTVFSAYADAMGELLSDNYADRGIPVMRRLKGTKHHPQLKDMPEINAEFWGKIIWAERMKLSRNYKLYEANEKWFRDALSRDNGTH